MNSFRLSYLTAAINILVNSERREEELVWSLNLGHEIKLSVSPEEIFHTRFLCFYVNFIAGIILISAEDEIYIFGPHVYVCGDGNELLIIHLKFCLKFYGW